MVVRAVTFIELSPLPNQARSVAPSRVVSRVIALQVGNANAAK